MAATALAATSSVAQTQVVQGNVVTVRWAAAVGPVTGYQVYVSRNGGAPLDEDIVATNEVNVAGQPGETIRVAVRAYGYPNGPTQPFEWGPESELSDPIVFESLPVIDPGLQPFVDCSTCRRFELRRADGSRWVSYPHPAQGSWDLLGVAEFVRGGTEAVLRERSGGALYVGELSSAGMSMIASVSDATFARKTVLPPVDLDGDGLAEIVVHDPVTGMVEVWGIAEGEFMSLALWVGPREIRLFATGDLDGDGEADLWYDGGHGIVFVVQMSDFTAVDSAFLAGPLSDSTAVDVADYDGDGVLDVFWRDDAGAMDLTLLRGNTSAPTLEVRRFVSKAGDAQRLYRGSRDLDGDPGGAEVLLQDPSTGVVEAAFPSGGTPGRRASAMNPGSLWRLVGFFWR